MRLNVGYTNNDPAIVAYNFVYCVDDLKGCLMVLQTNPGTENCLMGALQCLFKHNSHDYFPGIYSYRIVKSTMNQGIEAWWSMMRRQQSDWWISFFKDLEAFGGFRRENENDLRFIRYCFMPLLQQELDCLLERWNNHYISRSRQAVCPNGRHIVLHALPEETGFTDCLHHVNQDDIDFAFLQCREGSRSGSHKFDLRARSVFHRLGLSEAYNWREALQQYFNILEMNL